METFTVLSTATGMASLSIAHAPKALDSLNELAFKSKRAYKKSNGHAMFVLETLEQYGAILTGKEAEKLLEGFWRVILALNDLAALETEVAQEIEKAVAEGGWTLRNPNPKNLKAVKLLQGERKIRQAALDVLTLSKQTKHLTKTISTKARAKGQLAAARAKLLEESRRSGGTTPAAYPPTGHPELTASAISLLFQPGVYFKGSTPVNSPTARGAAAATASAAVGPDLGEARPAGVTPEPVQAPAAVAPAPAQPPAVEPAPAQDDAENVPAEEGDIGMTTIGSSESADSMSKTLVDA
ncbi:hypothetical protein B0H16DRAFT_1596047 [Mycena metata]|uniref:Uncharacterized protein n=1 Tax=Mycena metata TaxID=1033252 RepID=A0AAD7MN12_9AGAR|nr:hypothetical protein B0H16DRAFT_1596027 [Mycena metata]KAJ7724560.1 hypothetical protein B0H16DRAFT_1596047 [Mycena metata]